LKDTKALLDNFLCRRRRRGHPIRRRLEAASALQALNRAFPMKVDRPLRCHKRLSGC
jgi:hypothetical protein